MPVQFPSTPNFAAAYQKSTEASQLAGDPQAGSSEKQECVGTQRMKPPFFPLASPAAGAVEELRLRGLRAAAIGHK